MKSTSWLAKSSVVGGMLFVKATVSGTATANSLHRVVLYPATCRGSGSCSIESHLATYQRQMARWTDGRTEERTSCRIEVRQMRRLQSGCLLVAVVTLKIRLGKALGF